MQRAILSTADVARLFNVTETTVKRWADEGVLKCQKTPGGHRKFDMRYVVEFANVHSFEPLGTLQLDQKDASSALIEVAVLNRDFQVMKNAFVERALSPDRTDLFQYLSYLYQHHLQLWEIYDHVLSPAMFEIGERWARGEIMISHEHEASYETLDALAKLQAQILIKPRVNKSAVCACVDHELHEIGLRCAAYLFESEGWTVHYLGGGIPYDSIVGAMKELRPTAVCLSVTRTEKADDLKKHLKAIYAQAKSIGVTVILRGGVLPKDNGQGKSWDLMLNSTHELLDYIHRTHAEAAKSLQTSAQKK